MLEVKLSRIDACEFCIDDYCKKKFGKLPKIIKKTRSVFTCDWCFMQGFTVLVIEL